MNGICIELYDGREGGPISISSDSNFKAIRVRREDIPKFESELKNRGVYILLIGKNCAYVGKTADSLATRLFTNHSGEIDSLWHTAVCFISNTHINDDILKYLENALCEYAHLHYDECLTSNPSKANCNEKFRREKYAPAYADYQKCEKYFKIIRYYLETLSYIPLLVKESDPAYPVLPVDTDEKTQGDKSNSSGSGDDINHNETYEFFFESKARGSKGIALISIHCGHSQKRKSILKAGSVLSVEVSPVTPGAEKIVALREKLKAAGKVVNRELKEDIAFDSQSGAIKFLNGTSLNGNNVWKTADGVPLAELL